jgi:tRNA pseudouridine13 synthase
MRARFVPEDFVVEEDIRVPRGGEPSYTLYRVRKIARSTLDVQASLARALSLPRAAVHFPALKDRWAITWQYGTVHGDGPKELRGRGWSARRVGRVRRPLRPTDLRGNRFTTVLRDLGPEDVLGVTARLEAGARFGVPNYFGRQRFGSHSPGQEWVGKRILRRDAEGSLQAHLSQPMVGDPESVAAFKVEARAHWGAWDDLLKVAPRPSNYRSVLVYLRDHPEGYRRALNLVTPRVLALYLAAYQSLLWNRLLGRFLRRELEVAGRPCDEIAVAGEHLPLYDELPPNLLESWRGFSLPLFHHRAVYPEPEWSTLVEEMLVQEGLDLNDLKARLLRRAYLSKGERPILLFPAEARVLEVEEDERFAGRQRLTACFFLPRGSYASLFLRTLGAIDEAGRDAPAGATRET